MYLNGLILFKLKHTILINQKFKAILPENLDVLY